MAEPLPGGVTWLHGAPNAGRWWGSELNTCTQSTWRTAQLERKQAANTRDWVHPLMTHEYDLFLCAKLIHTSWG